jgi:hypothetical protein
VFEKLIRFLFVQELTHLTLTRRAQLGAPERSILTDRDEEEERQLSDYHGHLERAKSKTLKGRQSGSKEWREMRNELGLSEGGKKEGGMGTRHGESLSTWVWMMG